MWMRLYPDRGRAALHVRTYVHLDYCSASQRLASIKLQPISLGDQVADDNCVWAVNDGPIFAPESVVHALATHQPWI